MRVEVDQSGQIGKFNVDTVFAFSNQITYAIVLPARVKRQAYEHLKRTYRELRAPYLRLFAAGVFLLLRDHLDRLEHVVIDEEFTGHWAEIKGLLLGHIRRVRPDFPGEGLEWRRIGKRSLAHRRAYEIYRARRRRGKSRAQADRIIPLQELLALL